MTKLKILCLHGANSNNDITQIQLYGLGLTNLAECECLNAPHESKVPATGLSLFSDGPFYTWGTSEDEFNRSLEYLATYCQENGPFDGVYGFSLGVSIITALSHPSIWRDRLKLKCCPWNFAIMGCGGGSKMLGNLSSDITIDLPSFHIFGAKDNLLKDSQALEMYWISSKKGNYTHERGHAIDMDLCRREKDLACLLNDFLKTYK